MAYTVDNLDGDTLFYTEQSGPVLIDQGTLASIQDGGAGFGGTTLSVTMPGLYDTESLTVRHQGVGPGQIGVAPDGSILFEGKTIGVASAAPGTALQITFGAAATSAAVSALLRNLTYENTGDLPANGLIEINLTGSAGLLATAVVTLGVLAADDPLHAGNDSAAVTAGQTVTGNVLANDSAPGTSDALTVTGYARLGSMSSIDPPASLPGKYGTLTLKADGTYSYVASNAGGLPEGAVATDVFAYTVTAGSNVAAAQLAITVAGKAPASQVVEGAPGADSLTGGEGADWIAGLGGGDTLWGLGGADTLIGGAGSDRLDGGAGADLMYGGAGNDTFYVDNAGDRVFDSGKGTDKIITQVSFTLQKKLAVEVLQGFGTAASKLTLTGNEFGQKIIGSLGADTLNGKGGADILVGGRGKDAFVFDRPKAGPDKVLDFKVGEDKIHLVGKAFGLHKGSLSADAFLSYKGGAPKAHDAEDRVLYDRSKGTLYFDTDGTGGKAAVLVASFKGKPDLGLKDFLII